MDLSNKVSLLVGGTRLGGAVAHALAARGADVALSYYTNRAAADDAGGVVRSLGRLATVVRCDVTDAGAVQRMVDGVATGMGRLDVLIVMASRYRHVPFDDLTGDLIEQQLAVDMRGTFACMRAAVPHMRAAGGGRMITFSDWTAASGRPRYPGYAGYYVAKAGVKALTEAFALELAPDNILVNAIAPGPILPPDAMTDAERGRVEAATPLARWGGAEEIAKCVIALIDSDFITGETVRIDGGRHLR